MSVRREPKEREESDEPPIPDQARSRKEAQLRATKQVRRYAVHARLDRLVTLTLAEATDLADRDRVAATVARCFKLLKKRFPDLRYIWVLELHPGGHGYHCHAAVNRWLDPATIRHCWGQGFIDVRRIKTKSRGSLIEQSRLAARYLAKYATKADDEGRRAGQRRYSRSEGDSIPEFTIECDSWAGAEQWLRAKLRRPVSWQWSSDEAGDDWRGPTTLVLWE